jgi:hypothetical protein
VRIALDDAVSIVIERLGNAVAGEYVAHQEEVAVSILLSAEDGADDYAGGIVDGRQEGAPWLVRTEPQVRTAVDLQQHAGLREAIASPPMPWGAARMRSRRATGAQDAAHTGATEEDLVLARQELASLHAA